MKQVNYETNQTDQLGCAGTLNVPRRAVESLQMT